jgi:hypothetical protein
MKKTFFVSFPVWGSSFLVKFDILYQHFQRDIVRGVEGYIVTGSKQVEIGAPFVPLYISWLSYRLCWTVPVDSIVIRINWLAMEPMYAGNKLSDDSQKYGVENTCTSGDTLSRAATYFAKARSLMEKERGNMLKAFGTQVCIPNAGSGFSCAPNCKKNGNIWILYVMWYILGNNTELM